MDRARNFENEKPDERLQFRFDFIKSFCLADFQFIYQFILRNFNDL